MNVWKISFHDRDHGALVFWETNETAATMLLKSLQREQRECGQVSQGVERVQRINIPTDKRGLIRWLNENYRNDN